MQQLLPPCPDQFREDIEEPRDTLRGQILADMPVLMLAHELKLSHNSTAKKKRKNMLRDSRTPVLYAHLEAAFFRFVFVWEIRNSLYLTRITPVTDQFLTRIFKTGLL